MADYTKRSIEIHEWLLAQDITVELDKDAPCVKVIGEGGITQGVFPAYQLGYYNNRGTWTELEDICPYYGPGGEGNSLEALSGLGFVALDNHYGAGLTNDLPYQTWWTAKLHKWNKCKDGLGRFECGVKAKTRSGALCDLLHKLKEEK